MTADARQVSEDPSARTAPTRRLAEALILAVTAAGIAVLAGQVATAIHWSQTELAAAGALAVATLVTELFPLHLRHTTETATYSVTDVVWTADSGGKASAARRPVVGADKVAKAIIGIFRLGQKLPDVRIETAMCNSAPAVVVYSGDHLEGVFLVEVIDGKITHFYAMRNPEKLAGITIPRAISR